MYIEDYYPTDEEYFRVGSVQDCTGLIPAGLTDEEEAETYEEMYPYLSGGQADYFD